MYKLEEKIFFSGMQQAHGAVTHFSLCTGQSTELALIDTLAMDITPVIADFDKRRFEFVKINSEHGGNHVADYLVFHSELNAVHVIPCDNAGHLRLDGNVIAAAFSADRGELFKSWNNVLTENTRRMSGTGAVSINSHSLFAGSGGKTFSFAAVNGDGCAFELVLDRTENNITITVNGMMSKGSASRLDAANAVRRFYVDAEISVNKLNVNLLDGHAGTGNDGRNIADNYAFNNAIAGKQSADGVFIYTQNKKNIYEDITLRCANVST